MKSKKLLSILASTVMAFAISAPTFAFADDDDNSDTGNGFNSTADLVIINANPKDTFVAYKLIDIEYDQSKNSVTYLWDSSIKNCINKIYTESGIDDTPVENFTVDYYIKLGAENRKKLLASLFNHIHNASDHDIKPIMVDSTDDTSGTECKADDDGKATWKLAEMGGYFIEPVAASDVYEFIFKAVEPLVDDGENPQYSLENATVSVSSKHSPVSLQKFSSITDDKEAGSIEIGKEFSYYIIADVPKYGANALEKKFSITDEIPAGVDIKSDSIEVKAITSRVDLTPDDEDWVTMPLDESYTLTVTETNDHTSTFTVDVENTEDNKQFDKWYKYTISGSGAITKETEYDKILITYKAQLNKDAQLTAKNGASWLGNLNTATIEYTPFPYVYDKNNKLDTNTFSDTFDVYTYGLAVWKYSYENSAETGLNGAKFKLYSANAEGEKGDALTGVYYSSSRSGPWTEITDTTTLSTVDGHIYIKGLKGDSTYFLEETAAPSGYNLPAEDQRVITIRTKTYSSSAGLEASGSTDSKIKSAGESGYAYASILNSKGYTLPETGGSGVLYLKLIGIAAMAGAVIVVAVILVRPKKKADSE